MLGNQNRAKYKYSDEDRQLAIAYALGQVTEPQVRSVIGKSSASGTYAYLAFVMCEIIRDLNQKTSPLPSSTTHE